jgi:hypothetical protein
MQLPTVKLRNKRTGQLKIVNQTKYADNISQWSEWSIVSMRGGSAPDALVALEREQERIEEARKHKPSSPAYADPQRAFEARSGAEITTTYTDDKEYTKAVLDPVDAPPIPEIEEREVPVIGGSQTVKVRNKPGRKPKTLEDEVL